MSEKNTPINRFSGQLIALITKLFHPKSIRSLFGKIFGVLLVVFVALLLMSGFFFLQIMRNQVYASMKDTLNLYNSQIERDFTEALTFLSENCVQNNDFTSLGIAATSEEMYLHTVRIQKTLSMGNYSFSNIGGLFVYAPAQDIFIRQINATYHKNQSNLNCAEEIQALLRKHNQDGNLDLLELNQWTLLQTQDESFLMCVIQKRNLYTGVWVSLEQLVSGFTQFQDTGSMVICVDPAGYCLTGEGMEGVRLDLAGSIDRPSYLRRGLFQSYLIVSDRLKNSSYAIAALIPTNYITSQLTGLYGFMAFVFVWLVLLILILISMMKRFFNTPSEILQPAIAAMRAGEFQREIQTDTQYQEIRLITDAFNDMIGEIQHLRIHLYEDQLAKKEMELQYLRLQIAPHFLINCLNTIFIMSQDKDNPDIMHRTISTLSEHLRYSLATLQVTSLEEELYYVTNYLSLTQLRFPGVLTYRLDVAEEAYRARVVPHLLLMLTENAIKANLIMGESLHVQINGRLYAEGGTSWLHLTHIDSGRGFDQDSLERYNHIMEHPEAIEHGYGIGIYNIVTRMVLTMGDAVRICFSNEPGMGARIDMYFPLILYEEAPDGTD